MQVPYVLGSCPEALASGKLVYREVCSEGSQTAKSGTDEQERYTRLLREDKQAHHCNVQRLPNLFLVDIAGIGGRNVPLPGEASGFTCTARGVSRGHSSQKKRALQTKNDKQRSLTTWRRAERLTASNFVGKLAVRAASSPQEAKQGRGK